MFRRTSVVHVVDELARAQRRERARVDLEALLVGVAWALWSVRVELGLVLARRGGAARGRRACSARWAAWVVVVVVVALVLAVPAGSPVRVGGCCGRCGFGGRGRGRRSTRGVAAGPFRCPGVWSVERVPAGDAAATCASVVGSRSRELDARARAPRGVPAGA